MRKVWSLSIVVFFLLCQTYGTGRAEDSQVSQRKKILVTTVEDTADPPFDADDPCGVGTIEDLPGADELVSLREAIIAANNIVGAQAAIVFSPFPPGSVLIMSFDDSDFDTQSDALPMLCRGDLIINGDMNRDGLSDITLDGSLLSEGQNGLVVAASGIVLKRLTLRNFPGAGIAVSPQAAVITVTNTTLTGNVLIGNGAGVSLSPVNVQGATVSGLKILNNTISGNMDEGIIVLGGEGNASGNVVEATIKGNTVSGNGRFGVAVFGGRTSVEGEVATDNALDIDIVDNMIEGNALRNYLKTQ